MTVTVKFFASLREQLGQHEIQVDLDGSECTVQEIWRRATEAKQLPANVLASINMAYAKLDAPVHDGDEIAFFPPVTGG
ncbi:MAG: MoaD/ThiS family protein [Gammaproteobacteria bacterium]